MKKLMITMTFLVGFLNKSMGQNNSFGISVAVGKGEIMKSSLVGDASYDLNTGIAVGFQYERKLKEKLYLQTGINWYKNSVDVTPSFYPGIDMSPKNYDITLIYIPIFLRVDLSKYIFINGGFLADIDITKNKYLTSQSGMGAGLGIGTEISLTKNLCIKLNPYLNFHGLILAESGNYPERLFDAGFQVCFVIK